MAIPLIPLIAGILSAGGAVASSAISNAANKRAAQRQMDFQERMSSTAAQRSVEDYTRAGLNPGLAYERTASSPSGAAANIQWDDAVTKGISSAQSAAALKQQLELTKLETQERIALMRGQQEQSRTTALLDWEKVRSERVNRDFGISQQPHFDRLNAANALVRLNEGALTGYAIPGARNAGEIEDSLRQIRQGVGNVRSMGDIMSLLRGAPPLVIDQLFRRFKR